MMMPSFFTRLFPCLLAWFLVAGSLHAAPQWEVCVDDPVLASLIVEETSFNVFKPRHGDSDLQVSTIGRIKNTSTGTVEGINLEVQYFNAEKKLINVSNQRLYQKAIPAGGSLAFRIDTEALSAKSDYASQEVRVISVCTQKQQSQSSFWDTLTNYLPVWMPMFLLIAFLMALHLSNGRRKSPTMRSLAMSEQFITNTETMNILFKEQNQTLERIANALENKEER